MKPAWITQDIPAARSATRETAIGWAEMVMEELCANLSYEYGTDCIHYMLVDMRALRDIDLSIEGARASIIRRNFSRLGTKEIINRSATHKTYDNAYTMNVHKLLSTVAKMYNMESIDNEYLIYLVSKIAACVFVFRETGINMKRIVTAYNILFR